MSQQINGSYQEVNDSFPQVSTQFNSHIGVLEVGEGPPAPPWLQVITSSLVNKEHLTKISLKNDVFIAILYVLVHEVGFTVQGFECVNPKSTYDIRILRKLIDLSSVDRKEFSYHIPLVLYNCDLPCELVIVPNNNIFIVNFHVPNVETFSTSYNIDNYLLVNPDGSLEYSNLDELSKSFKEICHKFRNTILDHVDLPSLHITKLPFEILFKISTYLDPKSFINFTSTCSALKSCLYEDETLWKRLYKIQFASNSVPSSSCTWKKHFIDESRQRLRSRRSHYESAHYCDFPLVSSPHLYYMRLPRL